MKTFRRGLFPVLSGAVVVTAALAATGCSALGDRSNGSVSLSANGTGTSLMTDSQASSYQVLTLNNDHDLTFNQLLGINNSGVIAGYFGSGAQGHPNKGYELRSPFAQSDFANENYPGSVQTQVTGLNDDGITVGFFSTQNTASQSDNNFGFYEAGGHFVKVDFPTGDNASPAVNQLLGVNNSGIAVGFYTNNQGNNRGYEYDIRTRRFTRITTPGSTPGSTSAPSLTAAAINNNGDVAGFYNKTSSTVDGFIRLRNGSFTTLAFPGASATMATGINDSDEVVGNYTVGTGNSAVTHGFTWQDGKFISVNIPSASSTTINGLNDEGDIVGFFTDSAGNTDGFIGLP